MDEDIKALSFVRQSLLQKNEKIRQLTRKVRKLENENATLKDLEAKCREQEEQIENLRCSLELYTQGDATDDTYDVNILGEAQSAASGTDDVKDAMSLESHMQSDSIVKEEHEFNEDEAMFETASYVSDRQLEHTEQSFDENNVSQIQHPDGFTEDYIGQRLLGSESMNNDQIDDTSGEFLQDNDNSDAAQVLRKHQMFTETEESGTTTKAHSRLKLSTVAGTGGAPPMMALEFVKSKHGNTLLVFNGFLYCKERTGKAKVYWRCIEVNKMKCSARCITDSDGVCKPPGDHCHPAKESPSYVRIIKNETFNQYECTVCGKPNRDVDRLRLHMRTHTGERPHKCPQCEFSAAQSSNLKKHVVALHPTHVMSPCSHCARTFVTDLDLRHHVRRFHPYPLTYN